MAEVNVAAFVESLGFRQWPGADMLYLDILGRITITGRDLVRAKDSAEGIKDLVCSKLDNLLATFTAAIQNDKQKVMRGERLITDWRSPTDDESE